MTRGGLKEPEQQIQLITLRQDVFFINLYVAYILDIQ